MHLTFPTPISSSARVAKNASPISCSGKRHTASWCLCPPIGPISTERRSNPQFVNTNNASGGLAVSSHKPDPEPRGRREARFQLGQEAVVREQSLSAHSLRPV